MHDLELYIIARPTWMSHLKVIQFYWNLIISLQVISRASPALYININTLTKFIYLVYLHYSLNSVHAIDWNITNAFHKTSIKENRERLRSDNACVWVSVNHINSVCVCVCQPRRYHWAWVGLGPPILGPGPPILSQAGNSYYRLQRPRRRTDFHSQFIQ